MTTGNAPLTGEALIIRRSMLNRAALLIQRNLRAFMDRFRFMTNQPAILHLTERRKFLVSRSGRMLYPAARLHLADTLAGVQRILSRNVRLFHAIENYTINPAANYFPVLEEAGYYRNHPDNARNVRRRLG